jgi:hypothetical protein
MNGVLLASMLFLLACKPSKNSDTPIDSSATATTVIKTGSHYQNEDKGTISFKVNGKQVDIPILMIGYVKFPSQPKSLTIIGITQQQKEMIQLGVNGCGVGDYIFTEALKTALSNNGGVYTPDCSKSYSSYLFTSGRITISGFDTVNNIINGTFSCIGKRINDDSSIKITEGVIKNGKISVM